MLNDRLLFYFLIFFIDSTPAKYITGIITEEGICYPPFIESLKIAKINAEKRIQQQWKANM